MRPDLLPQTMLDAAGPQAERILHLWWITLALCAFVFLAVLAACLWALWRAPRAELWATAQLPSMEKRSQLGVIAATIVSALGLLFLIAASFATDRALARIGTPALQIDVTAHQWWWEARYQDTDPSRIFATANELHIPVGTPVLLRLRADDVIHSLWVPNLGGKKDLIPGRDATLTLQADKPGVYRGQCAEFCGFQHAKMAFVVFAEPREQYEAWAQSQRAPAPQPASAQAKRGHDLFVSGRCAMCHAIQGTVAQGQRAPDLTHLAGRQTLAAGTLPNTVGHLAGWILDPQGIKPGVNMPANPMPPEDLHALLAYLGTLK
jgi:cytochrome c oxidase subunit 2